MARVALTPEELALCDWYMYIAEAIKKAEAKQ